jgi:hypothetical protein
MERSFKWKWLEGHIEAIVREVKVVITQTACLLLCHPPRINLRVTPRARRDFVRMKNRQMQVIVYPLIK